MTFRSLTIAATVAAAVVALAVSSSAPAAAEAAVALRHARLVKSVPAKDSTVESPKIIQLWFSEKVSLPLVTVTVVHAGGAAAELGKAAYDGPAAPESPLTLAVKAPLAPGSYTLNWTVAGADGHPVKGSFGFAVKAAH